jgi:hypothetical protein
MKCQEISMGPSIQTIQYRYHSGSPEYGISINRKVHTINSLGLVAQRPPSTRYVIWYGCSSLGGLFSLSIVLPSPFS